MNLNKLDRNSLIALATSKGIRWASRKKSNELIKILSAGSMNPDIESGDSASEGVACPLAVATDAEKDSSDSQEEADVFGLTGAEGSGEPPAKEGIKGASIIAGENGGGELGALSPPLEFNQGFNFESPVYDAEVVLHIDLDVLILLRLSDKKILARLPLQGLIGRGRTLKLREIRSTGQNMGFNIRPGYTLQP